MKFSVIVPNLNSAIVDHTLDSLLNQAYPRDDYEVIVVGLDAPGKIRLTPGVTFDQTERPYNPSEARNRGARQAKGEILVFIDSDCIASQNLLATLARWFADERIAGIGGGIRLRRSHFWNLADNIALFYEFLDGQPMRPARQLPSLNLALRKTIFAQAGGFDHRRYPLPAGEDFDLTYRLTRDHHSLFFAPEAWVLHDPPRNSLKDLWRHAYRIGQYSTKVDPRYPEIALPAWMRNKWMLILLSPFMALGITIRVFLKNPGILRYICTFPAVLISKLAWCSGAANSPFLTESKQ